MITNSDQMKHSCHSKGCPNSHSNTQCSPLWQQSSRVFSHANCHTAIESPKHLAPVVAIRPFEQGHIVGLREAGWTYQRIAAHLYRWCVAVEHSHTCRPWFRTAAVPRSTEARQDRRVARAAVTTSRHMLPGADSEGGPGGPGPPCQIIRQL